MGEGKILVKVHELFLGSGGSVAAATLTWLTTPRGFKALSPAPEHGLGASSLGKPQRGWDTGQEKGSQPQGR